MYFGYQNHTHPHSMSLPSQSMTQGINTSIAKSVLLEPQVITLQRESENYIRKVEQEKKHYYSVEETWALVQREWKEKKEKLVEIQKRKQSPRQIQLHANLKNLENNLDQAICKLNETESGNQQLQRQIDSLRKERVQYLNIHQQLQKQLQNVESEQIDVETFKKDLLVHEAKSKEQIALLKRKNDSEKEVYVEQFDRLQKEVMDEKRQREATKMAARKEKIENIDTGTLMKQRLKRLIANNKEKVKIIDQYLKNMRVIDEAFTQIKDASGITDIEEIMNTFIKSEEQNYSLYNYVDILSQEIDTLTDQNEDLQKKIDQQLLDNEEKMRLLKATPLEVKHKRKNNQIIEQKQQEINALRVRMDTIAPDLQTILVELSATKLVIKQFNKKSPNQNKQFDYQLAFNLNESSLEIYLQDLEYYINILVAKQQIALNESVVQSTLLLDQIPIKDFNSSRTQQPLIANEEVQVNENQRLLDPNKLRQMALDAIKKKKQP